MLRRYRRLRSYTRPSPVRLKPRRGQIKDPVYRAWIRSLPCLVQTRECRGGTDPHHVGHFGRARDNDYNTVPLCRRHHDLVHQIHLAAFEERFGLSFDAAIAGLRDEYEVTKGRRIA